MDNQLKQKLSAFEAPPPEAMWQRLSAVLDDQPMFAVKLQEYSQPPEDEVWKRIENELNEALPAKLIPFRTRYKRPIRYASAAAIIGVVLIVNTLITKRTEAGALGNTQQSTIGTGVSSPKNNSASTPGVATKPATVQWIVYTDARGDTMRMQKKLFDLLQCRNGDDACRKRIAELRKKLSSANASTDFAGLLEMVRQIK